jgi:hypothetical protein
MKWQPIITDERTKEYFLDKIYSIANSLAKSTSNSPSLIGDNSGLSIFWEYLFLFSKDNTHRNYSVKLINASADFNKVVLFLDKK